jgi:hypothetical protein
MRHALEPARAAAAAAAAAQLIGASISISTPVFTAFCNEHTLISSHSD